MQTIHNFILHKYHLLPPLMMYVKDPLVKKNDTKGIVSDKGLRHEYEGCVS